MVEIGGGIGLIIGWGMMGVGPCRGTCGEISIASSSWVAASS